jgi:hypothetical protein
MPGPVRDLSGRQPARRPVDEEQPDLFATHAEIIPHTAAEFGIAVAQSGIADAEPAWSPTDQDAHRLRTSPRLTAYTRPRSALSIAERTADGHP